MEGGGRAQVNARLKVDTRVILVLCEIVKGCTATPKIHQALVQTRLPWKSLKYFWKYYCITSVLILFKLKGGALCCFHTVNPADYALAGDGKNWVWGCDSDRGLV